MKTDNLVVSADTTVGAVKQMLNATVKEALVKDATGNIIGHIRASHFAKGTDETAAGEICASFKVETYSSEPLKKALSDMIEKGTSHAAVRDESGKFVGELTMDCFQKVVNHQAEW